MKRCCDFLNIIYSLEENIRSKDQFLLDNANLFSLHL